MAEAKTPAYKTPHVHTAVAAILSNMSVAKGGVLPGNMGGKPYITAVDTASEVKKQFVENNLIFLPKERIFQHKEVINKDRINVLIAITGEYTFISTVDGSSLTVSGTGDGLAGGTAVASNIASTNAMKNALLRTFLITEQSVEDEAKNGPAEPAQNQAVRTAQRPETTRPTTSGGKEKIRNWIGSDEDRRTKVNTAMELHKSNGLSGDALWNAIATEVGA